MECFENYFVEEREREIGWSAIFFRLFRSKRNRNEKEKTKSKKLRLSMTMLMMLLKQTKFPQYVNISMDPILRRNQEKKPSRKSEIRIILKSIVTNVCYETSNLFDFFFHLGKHLNLPRMSRFFADSELCVWAFVENCVWFAAGRQKEHQYIRSEPRIDSAKLITSNTINITKHIQDTKRAYTHNTRTRRNQANPWIFRVRRALETGWTYAR